MGEAHCESMWRQPVGEAHYPMLGGRETVKLSQEKEMYCLKWNSWEMNSEKLDYTDLARIRRKI